MSCFIAYEPSGRIRWTMELPDSLIPLQVAALQASAPDLAHVVVEGPVDPNGHFIDAGAVRELAELQLSAPATVAAGQVWRVSEIPAGTKCSVEGEGWVEDDGVLELTFALPGRYTAFLDAPGFKKQWLSVEVV